MQRILVQSVKGLGLSVLLLTELTCGWAVSAQRITRDFNADWRFAKGDLENAAVPTFNDSAWQPVRLPHDWAIAGPFDPQTTGRTGKLPWRGVGWYRKTFPLPPAQPGRRVYLDFDGVMAFPQVYVNGVLAGEWDYGYMSFRVDATAHIRFGGKNVVAVRADTTRHGSRWYPGAGIYRKVTLTICDPVSVAHWGVFITTPAVTDARAVVRVQTEVENHTPRAAQTRVEVVLADPDGKEVARTEKPLAIAAGQTTAVTQKLEVPDPKRWDIVSPRLYTARVTVRRDGRAVDAVTAPFGIRTFEFTANDGFHLNGRRVELHGVDLHHDHGPLGAAFFPRAMERQLRLMQDMGANALRTSHNPPAPDVLALCDRLGLVVFDEGFDKWNATADLRDQSQFEPFMARQVRHFVRRDRNHPSVVVWSIGNEMGDIEANRRGDGPGKVAYMVKQFKQHDPTRPVTMGCLVQGAVRDNTHVLDALDITSWNYGRKYLNARRRYPDKPIIYSESASALSTRGFYKLPHPKFKTDYDNPERYVDSYDLNSASGPRDIPDWDFWRMQTDRYVAGEFVWTGFDYLGEPTPFTREARSSYFGIVDLCGLPKDRYFIYRSHWAPDKPTVHLLPHWNWPNRIGQPVPVYVYTSGDEAELFLHGRSLGRRSKKPFFTAPQNLAQDKPAVASSEEGNRGNVVSRGNDGNPGTRWCAATNTLPQWWQVDLQAAHHLRLCRIHFEKPAPAYAYQLRTSTDGRTWQTVAEHSIGDGKGNVALHPLDVTARWVRLEFTGLDGGWASFHELALFDTPTAPEDLSYYAIVDTYRLRWENVAYEPGELKAVAYRHGKKIGEATMQTAGPPAALRLTPEWTDAAATGNDLWYVRVDAVDEQGAVCPLATNRFTVHIEGPATLAGIGNGDPLGLDPFPDNQHPLFFGKAVVILRSMAGKTGAVVLRADSTGLKATSTALRSTPGRPKP